jgi:hypothetical protein
MCVVIMVLSVEEPTFLVHRDVLITLYFTTLCHLLGLHGILGWCTNVQSAGSFPVSVC